MKINKATGMRIVTELSDIIHQRINLMDEKGRIIASSDGKRIGTVHGGACKIINENLSELIIYTDEEWEGSRAGLNLPLEMDGRCIGVVGISGEYAQIEKYGRIIKKMTEILLVNEKFQEQKRLSRDAYAALLREWIIDGRDVDEPRFLQRAAHMKLDVQKERRVLVLSDDGSSLELRKEERLENILYRITGAADVLLFRSGIKYILLVPEQSNERIQLLCSQLQQTVQKEIGIRLFIGVDSFAVKGNEMRAAYMRAEKAYHSAYTTENASIIFYNELNLEIFIREIPRGLRQEFIGKIFRNCSSEEIRRMVTILRILYSCNGSIGQASQILFMHKNTLQYKLNRLAEKTGINPRTPQGTALYYLAIAFYDLENE